jgi:TolB protein
VRKLILCVFLFAAFNIALTQEKQDTQEKSATSGLGGAGPVVNGTPGDPLRDPREKHFRHVKQLTFGGQNAEAYFSYDGKRLIFMSTHKPYECDQIFTMNTDGSDQRLVSTGQGRTTCGYFYADGKHILYSSTHEANVACPPRPDYSKGYVWGVYSSYQMYSASDDGTNLKPLTKGPGYNAEGTISANGKKIVFTSSRSGDLDIYTMNTDGTGVRRLTNTLGYDGGPFFSPDGKWITYRAHHPTAEPEITKYKSLLAQDLVEPNEMDLYVMRANGSHQHQITNLGGASFGPSFYPDGQHIIFSSNHEHPKSSQFELYSVDRDGQGLERVTFAGGFSAFPQFSPDGKQLVFISNRNGKMPHEINVFVADWVP